MFIGSEVVAAEAFVAGGRKAICIGAGDKTRAHIGGMAVVDSLGGCSCCLGFLVGV